MRAGLLLALRGPNGGYSLTRPASEIALLEVVEVVDGPLRGPDPLALEGGERLEGRLPAVYEEVIDLVRRRLAQVRLSDLAGKR